MTALNIAIAGCGNIAEAYAADLATYPHLRLLGCTDVDLARAQALAARYGLRVYESLDDLLADPAVELVVNLTTHHAHYEVNKACLEAGKHVHSEKPLALRYAEAQELVELAREKGLRLGGAPFTPLGEAQQTAWKLVREGRLGTVRALYAEVNWGRIERWHPNPEPFYDVGALYDVGVYPLMLLTTMFGPARRVSALGATLLPDRVTKDGRPYRLTTPDFVVSLIELAGGPLLRLTTNFYVDQRTTRQAGVEIHGDRASLAMSQWDMPNALVHVAEFGEPFAEPEPWLREPSTAIRWGLNVAEIAEALAEGRPHRVTGEQAAHVVEILNAATQSMASGRPVELVSSFAPPAPMPWAA